MLTIRNLDLFYDCTAASSGSGERGHQVLFDVNLAIEQGDKVAIIGPSGAGKSSLLHYIHKELEHQAALCSQEQGLVDNLSLYHNVYMGALARHGWWYNLINLIRPFSKHLTAIQSLCDRLELDQALTKKVDTLSGGQRQRVALARAVYQRQPVFIGDEPFSALDPLMARRLIEQLFLLHTSVIMVVHDRELALSHFDRVIALSRGRVVIDSPSDQVDKCEVEALYQSDVTRLKIAC
ncbi:ATP-binding cassette domain-containing protein [Paraferrimonas sedimenticola]|uniref:Phosphonates import ATP-binding protein PhnC 1 n=1 Tax=Paraferrimonas sedimenticola TaxID=375674 RepID=A0AA37VZK9_9GAMM|nr:ATP-binding cassette domain-containing protein [Paraferrimonas sedimenticola]GLP97329.1 phosphonates import ATP-binding protein PhnC 1 [Paraferrimonas sedimenticola]